MMTLNFFFLFYVLTVEYAIINLYKGPVTQKKENTGLGLVLYRIKTNKNRIHFSKNKIYRDTLRVKTRVKLEDHI